MMMPDNFTCELCTWSITYLQLHKKELVVFAVNDNPEVHVAAGGAHW